MVATRFGASLGWSGLDGSANKARSESGPMDVTGLPGRRRHCEARTVVAVPSRYDRTSPFDDAKRNGPSAVLKTSEVRSSASARLPTRAYISRYRRSTLSRYTASQL